MFIQQGLNCKVKSIVARDVLYILHIEMRVGRENGLVRANVVSSNPACPSRVGRSTRITQTDLISSVFLASAIVF